LIFIAPAFKLVILCESFPFEHTLEAWNKDRSIDSIITAPSVYLMLQMVISQGGHVFLKGLTHYANTSAFKAFQLNELPNYNYSF